MKGNKENFALEFDVLRSKTRPYIHFLIFTFKHSPMENNIKLYFRLSNFVMLTNTARQIL